MDHPWRLSFESVSSRSDQADPSAKCHRVSAAGKYLFHSGVNTVLTALPFSYHRNRKRIFVNGGFCGSKRGHRNRTGDIAVSGSSDLVGVACPPEWHFS